MTPGWAGLDRRGFLRAGAALLAAPALGERLWADPFAPLPRQQVPTSPVRVRGRVLSGGRGVPGAAVSDGLQVVAAGRDGRFELVTDRARSGGFISLVPPAGYQLPVGPSGSLLLHHPVPQDRDALDLVWRLNPVVAGDDDHAFLVLADPQTQDAEEMARFHAETVPDVRATLRGIRAGVPVFGVGCGDLMYDDLSLFPEYQRAVKAMGIPFAQVVGNHDLDRGGATDEDSIRTFMGLFGPNRFSFNRGRVHYVVLDDVFWHGSGYLGYLGEDQLTWLAADLALVAAGTAVVVFIHIPVFSSSHIRAGTGQRNPELALAVTNREALYQLLRPYRARIISGHMHECDHLTEGGVREHNLGAVCGAWWTADICYDGTPNGYAVYQVRGEELRWRYKGTGLSDDVRLRVYPRGADPSAPGEFVANVWDWDPDWTVVWYQGGDRRGVMGRRVGLDPLATELFAGADKPRKRAWVDPAPTNHLFYAPVEAGARDIRVEAIDPWGNSFGLRAEG